MKINQLEKYIVDPVLKSLGMYSPDAVQLMLGTAIQESHAGEYIKQLGDGPACGIFQIEPRTAQDIIDNYLKYRKHLFNIVKKFYNEDMSLEENLIGNLYFQVAIARICYYRKPTAIPKDIKCQADYWKEHYNTFLGKGTTEEYIDNYKRFIGE